MKAEGTRADTGQNAGWLSFAVFSRWLVVTYSGSMH